MTDWILKFLGIAAATYAVIRALSGGWEDLWIWGSLLVAGVGLWFLSFRYREPEPDETLPVAVDHHPKALFFSALPGNVVEYRFGKLMSVHDHQGVTQRVGPFTLIPHHGTHGASSRDYAAAKSWYRDAYVLIHQSTLIVVQVGPKPTLIWELAQVISYAPPQEVMLVLPGSRQAYVAFRRWSAHLFPHPLPPEPPPHRLIAFHSGWQPYPGNPRHHAGHNTTAVITARGRWKSQNETRR